MADLRLVGVTFRNEDGSSRQEILTELYDRWWTEGLEIAIELRPEDNKYDPNAVAVFAKVKDWPASRQVGHISAEEAPLVRRAIANDLVGQVRFKEMGVSKRGGVWARLGIARKISRGVPARSE